jgi:hypothetical protein
MPKNFDIVSCRNNIPKKGTPEYDTLVEQFANDFGDVVIYGTRDCGKTELFNALQRYHRKNKQAVVGSRTITDFDFSKLNLTNVVTGGANGIDQAVEKYCLIQAIPCKVITPNYLAHGKAAPHIRNRKIIDQVDVVHIIWDGQSKGTSSVMEYAYRQNKKRVIYNRAGEILFSNLLTDSETEQKQ